MCKPTETSGFSSGLSGDEDGMKRLCVCVGVMARWGGGLEEKSSLQKAHREGWHCATCAHGTGGHLEFPHGSPG